MTHKIFLLCLACLLYLSVDLFGQGKPPEPITLGESVSIYSNILKEERKLLIYLPSSHQDSTLSEKHPVLFVLDGDWYFPATAGMLAYAKGAFSLPEMIVVAISNTDRVRDFTPTRSNQNMFGEEIQGLENSGGGPVFIRFLQEELIPYIDTSYRAADHRILAGHSFGGLLVNHLMTTQPELFHGYILIDPSLWWDQARQVAQTERFLNTRPNWKNRLFFALADHDTGLEAENGPHVKAMADYQALFRAATFPNLEDRFAFFADETHASVGLPAMYQGLRFLFKGYRPADSVFQHLDLLEAHFSKLSEAYGVEMWPPEGLVRNLGWGAQYGEKNLEKALDFFSLNLKHYPKSANAHKVL
ncbi:MAG: alpha/beta hydrolase-fold protein, partial [Bacteroidota bacterium]